MHGWDTGHPYQGQACAQMTSQQEQLLSLDHYLRKTVFKTASLMANSCQAVALLGAQSQPVSQLAWHYGHHLGLAFQVSSPLTSQAGWNDVMLLPCLVSSCPTLTPAFWRMSEPGRSLGPHADTCKQLPQAVTDLTTWGKSSSYLRCRYSSMLQLAGLCCHLRGKAAACP